MTRSSRRIIFIIATIIFLSAGYVAILYAQGYRYNFAKAQFSRTGAVSLHTNTPSSVLVNGKVVDSTSFITNSASISGLLPGTYTLAIQKDGYSKWQKTVTVQEGFVQDFPHIMLLPMAGVDHENVVKEVQNLLYTPTPTPKPTPSPTKRTPSTGVSGASGTESAPSTTVSGVSATKSPRPSASVTPNLNAPFYIASSSLFVQTPEGPTVISTDITNVYPSDDGQKLIWFIGKQVWLYWLNDQNEQPFHKTGDIAVIGHFTSPIRAIAWFRDNDHIAVDIGSITQPSFRILELDTRGGQNIISL